MRRSYIRVLTGLCIISTLIIIGTIFSVPSFGLLAIPFIGVALACAHRIGERTGSIIWDDDLRNEVYQVAGKAILNNGDDVLVLRDKNSRLIAIRGTNLLNSTLQGSRGAQLLVPNSLLSPVTETSGGKGLEIES